MLRQQEHKDDRLNQYDAEFRRRQFLMSLGQRCFTHRCSQLPVITIDFLLVLFQNLLRQIFALQQSIDDLWDLRVKLRVRPFLIDLNRRRLVEHNDCGCFTNLENASVSAILRINRSLKTFASRNLALFR